MNLPLSFRGIVRLAKKHNLKLTQRAGVRDYKKYGEGCALTTLAIENNLSFYSEVYDDFYTQGHCHPMYIKLRGIECGFEDWEDLEDYEGQNLTLFKRYYKIGERLREYAGKK